jgi:hypothetical protein
VTPGGAILRVYAGSQLPPRRSLKTALPVIGQVDAEVWRLKGSCSGVANGPPSSYPGSMAPRSLIDPILKATSRGRTSISSEAPIKAVNFPVYSQATGQKCCSKSLSLYPDREQAAVPGRERLSVGFTWFFLERAKGFELSTQPGQGARRGYAAISGDSPWNDIALLFNQLRQRNPAACIRGLIPTREPRSQVNDQGRASSRL